MVYEDYIYKWDNDLHDKEEYSRIDKYKFAQLKLVRRKLAVYLNANKDLLDVNQELQLMEISSMLNRIHQVSTSLEKEFENKK